MFSLGGYSGYSGIYDKTGRAGGAAGTARRGHSRGGRQRSGPSRLPLHRKCSDLLFTDRLEIVSPGGLPALMTEADLGVKSIPRNPLLFGVLHRMEAVERIGSGFRRIRDLCREHGVADPPIDVSDSWVTTTLHRPTSKVWTYTGIKQEPCTKWEPSPHQVTAQVDRNLQQDHNILSNNMLQILSSGLEDLTAQVTAQVVWHCRRPRFAKGDCVDDRTEKKRGTT